MVVALCFWLSACIRTSKTTDLAVKIPGENDLQFPEPWRRPSTKGGVCLELMFHKMHVVAFVNAGSGDQRGDAFVKHLNAILGSSGRAFELPRDLDAGFEEIAEKQKQQVQVRILACGGDGTVTWVLSEIQDRRATYFANVEAPPVGIIPLGTGNDLARSLGWGAALTDSAELETYVRRVLYAQPVLLDQWKLTLRPENGLPAALKPTKRFDTDFVGYFTNYFSVGMDAETAYEVGRSRKGVIGKCCFRSRCIRPCRFVHGGLLCYVYNAPDIFRCCCCRTRALNDDDLQVRLQSDAEPSCGERDIFRKGESEFRQFTLTNLNSYGAGMDLYGEAASVSPNDGQLEAFTLEGPCSVAAVAMAKKVARASCGSVPVLHRAKTVKLMLKEGQYFQMDGEPWRLNAGCSAVVELNRQVTMLCPPVSGHGAGDWSGKQQRCFWEKPSVLGQDLEMARRPERA
eukprot:TRINITY_DN16845_c0_g1_i2.p1 TRINITY_DN16845_c0_g1~~TRINITY_DN16845_c0_g1_i2.p1  ORF type:complete len:482 (-),score=64.05 TRINITY_DN16845_c0_g1_i2:128-1501(-)